MSEFEPLFTASQGELECGCQFDQPGVIERGDWRDCPNHGPLVQVVHAQTCTPPVIGDDSPAEVQRVRIMLNPDPLAMLSGYRPGTPVFPVLDYVTSCADHAWLREQAWQVGNTDDPADRHDEATEREDRFVDEEVRELAVRYRQQGTRSLGVGDVVAIGDAFYACAGLGWDRIDEPFIGHGPVPTDAPSGPADGEPAGSLPSWLGNRG